MKSVALGAVLGFSLPSFVSAQGGSTDYKPKRLNKMIELLDGRNP